LSRVKSKPRAAGLGCRAAPRSAAD
jgi:hypothetical protein